MFFEEMIMGSDTRWTRLGSGINLRRGRRKRPAPRVAFDVLTLEQRQLLSQGSAMGPAHPFLTALLDRQVLTSHFIHEARAGHPTAIQVARVTGHRGGAFAPVPGIVRLLTTVTKAPNFYEFYTGPRTANLDVVGGGAVLTRRGLFLSGTMQGTINTAPANASEGAYYVWGINRGSPNAVTPFPNRPGIRFDDVVVVSIQPGTGVTGFVQDVTAANSTPTPLSPSDIHVFGRSLVVEISPSLLPTPPGGVPISQYSFNLWPRTSLQMVPNVVASFLPEDGMAPFVTRVGLGRGSVGGRGGFTAPGGGFGLGGAPVYTSPMGPPVFSLSPTFGGHPTLPVSTPSGGGQLVVPTVPITPGTGGGGSTGGGSTGGGGGGGYGGGGGGVHY
jgi:hypothetical protein